MSAGRNILIVDDDEALRHSLAEQLHLHEEFEVEEVGSGSEAMDIVTDDRFDLLLLDVGLPDMDGRELCRLMRRSGHKMPIIMLTAADGEADTILGLESGANDYVTKPIDISVALARVDTQLALRRANREIEALARELEIRNAFVRRTFGRYVSDEIVTSLLESHDGLELRGEGDVLGAAQSGARSSLRLLRVVKDADLILRAREIAASIFAEDPTLERHPALRATIERRVTDADRAALGKN